jgi:hypothetical protein
LWELLEQEQAQAPTSITGMKRKEPAAEHYSQQDVAHALTISLSFSL